MLFDKTMEIVLVYYLSLSGGGQRVQPRRHVGQTLLEC